jgi:integrase
VVKRAGMSGFPFHDLRHTGSTLAAAGATLRDLMRRLGHSSTVAASRYLHAVEGRDAEIAAALSDIARNGNVAKLPRSVTSRSSR